MRPRNEQCPRRKPGLWHRHDGEWQCAHCGATLEREDPIARLRALVVSGPAQPDPIPDEDPLEDHHAALTEAEWHRVIYERWRFEHGEITDWPDGPPPRPDAEFAGLITLRAES